MNLYESGFPENQRAPNLSHHDVTSLRYEQTGKGRRRRASAGEGETPGWRRRACRGGVRDATATCCCRVLRNAAGCVRARTDGRVFVPACVRQPLLRAQPRRGWCVGGSRCERRQGGSTVPEPMGAVLAFARAGPGGAPSAASADGGADEHLTSNARTRRRGRSGTPGCEPRAKRGTGVQLWAARVRCSAGCVCSAAWSWSRQRRALPRQAGLLTLAGRWSSPPGWFGAKRGQHCAASAATSCDRCAAPGSRSNSWCGAALGPALQRHQDQLARNAQTAAAVRVVWHCD